MKVQINLGKKSPGWLQNSGSIALAIKPILDALIQIDLAYLHTHKVPPLYQSGVRYQREPPGIGFEMFDPIPVVLQRGWGDCDDLACWRVAELRFHGEKVHPRIQWRKYPNGRLYHITVRRSKFPDDDPRSIEDPSKILGMRGEG